MPQELNLHLNNNNIKAKTSMYKKINTNKSQTITKLESHNWL